MKNAREQQWHMYMCTFEAVCTVYSQTCRSLERECVAVVADTVCLSQDAHVEFLSFLRWECVNTDDKLKALAVA